MWIPRPSCGDIARRPRHRLRRRPAFVDALVTPTLRHNASKADAHHIRELARTLINGHSLIWYRCSEAPGIWLSRDGCLLMGNLCSKRAVTPVSDDTTLPAIVVSNSRQALSPLLGDAHVAPQPSGGGRLLGSTAARYAPFSNTSRPVTLAEARKFTIGLVPSQCAANWTASFPQLSTAWTSNWQQPHRQQTMQHSPGQHCSLCSCRLSSATHSRQLTHQTPYGTCLLSCTPLPSQHLQLLQAQ